MHKFVTIILYGIKIIITCMVAAGVYSFYNIIIIGKISDGRNNESDNIIIIK